MNLSVMEFIIAISGNTVLSFNSFNKKWSLSNAACQANAFGMTYLGEMFLSSTSLIVPPLCQVFSQLWPWQCWPCRGTWWSPGTGSSPCPPLSQPCWLLFLSGLILSLWPFHLFLALGLLDKTRWVSGTVHSTHEGQIYLWRHLKVAYYSLALKGKKK